MEMQNDAHNYFEQRIKRIRIRRWILSFLRNVLIAAAVIYLLFGVVFGLAIVHGDSMSPSLHENDLVLFLRLGQYNREDIVLIKTDSKEDYIKRIIAVAGEEINIDEKLNQVLINDNPLLEPYIFEDTYPKTGASFPLVLDENEFFVLGDNRGNSKDSRNYGPITKERVKGRVIAVFRITA